MNTINQLHLFVKVVEYGSFSAAARHFDITPSAVSRQISHLEDELGTRLFHRTTRQQSLTEAGEIYYEYAVRIKAEHDAAQLAVQQLSSSPKGLLRITAEKDFAETFIQPLLPEFFARYPEIQLHLIMETSLVDLVAIGIDLAIRIGHLEDSTLVARKLMSTPSLVCASPAYLEQHTPPQTPQELSQHNCLSYRTNHSQLTWQLEQAGQRFDVPVSGNLRANSLAMLRDAALKDLGVIFVPQWFVQNELDQGLLRNLNFTTSNTPVYALFANSRQLAPKIRAFIDFIAEKLPNQTI